MKIAYVNASYNKNHTGGGHVHVEQFIKNAIALGHEIWVYPGNQVPGTQTIPIDRLNHIKTQRKMDALYIRLERSSPRLCSWSVPPRRLLYDFPVVVWEFNTLPDELCDQVVGSKNPKEKKYLKKYSSGCDLAVCVSPMLSEMVSERLDCKNVITVPNGSDPELFTPDVTTAPRMNPFLGKFNVVWIGTLNQPWHDIKMLSSAARLVLDSQAGKEIVFHIIGPGLSGLMADMPPNVFYWGAEKYRSLPSWLASMDVGLSLYKPSNASLGSPLKAFDYLSSGLPVISTEHPLVSDILKEMDANELVIPYGSSDLLANLILQLAADPERTKKLGNAGRQLIIDKYNWKNSVQSIIDEIALLRAKKSKS